VTALALAAAIVAFVAAVAAIVLAVRNLRLRAAVDDARAAADDAAEHSFNVLETVGDGIYIVDDTLVVTHVNEEAERLLRSTADSLVGRPLREILDPLGSELVPEIRIARRTHAPIERVHTFPATQTFIEVRIHAGASETLISLRDVSQRTRAELQLRKNEHRLQLVTQHVDAVLWSTDREGRFTAISGGALRDLGLQADEMIARPSDALIGADVLRDVFDGRSARAEGACSGRWLRHHIEPLADDERNVVGAVGVSIDITELNRVRDLLFDAAHRDRLTGLPNRLALEQRLTDVIADAEKSERSFAVLFLDLDRFKTINDSLGHGAGDDVLRAVAHRLEGAVRTGEVIARPGGDEFVILLPSVDDLAQLQAVSQRLLRQLAVPFAVRGRQLYVSASMGVAIFPEHGHDAESLIAHADAAMYRAKALGGNRCVLYDVSLHAVAVDRLALENDLRSAVVRDELELRFQPIVNVASERIVGCEALVRWRHPVRGMILPDTFVDIAEETGAIVEIDRWVLREACATAAQIRAFVPGFRISVNVSSRDLREPGLPELVAEQLAEHRLPPSALGIEITETVSLDDSVLPVLRELHALGLRIAMDDFGMGFSSLSYLKRLPVSVLKVDRSFVRDVATDPYDHAIVASIVAVARALDFTVVAEGVETAEQLARITALGCDEAQGYRFGKPQTLAQLVELIGSDADAARTAAWS
jgi:diguanylate cyclase (GGDEF)-like protein/PAS domain S-box-containing protein